MEKTPDEIWLEEHGPTPSVDDRIVDAVERATAPGDLVEHDPLELVKEI